MDVHSDNSTLDKIRCTMRKPDWASALALCQAENPSHISENPEFALLYGILLCLNKDIERGSPIIDQALLSAPDNPAWESDMAYALALRGQLIKARELLERVCQKPAACAVDFSRLGGVRLQLGELDAAESAYIEAVHREPGRAEWHSNIGGIRARQYRLDEALEQYERAIGIDPANLKIRDLRDRILVALDKTDDLVTEREAEVRENPESITSRVQLARAYDLADQPESAVRTFREAVGLAMEPRAADAEDGDPGKIYLEMAGRMAARSLFPLAMYILTQAQQEGADAKAVSLAKANCLTQMGMGEKALEVLDSLEKDDVDPQIRLARSQALSEAGNYAEAEKILRNLLETYPGNPTLLSTLGETLLWIGRMDEATECFQKAAEIHPMALASLVQAKSFPDDPAVIDRMEKLANNPFMPDTARGSMAFGLARVYERRQSFDEAFDWLQEANMRTGKTVQYDCDRFSRYVDGIIDAFTPMLFERLAGTGSESCRPVFVCGMPRSGTTLTEQILGSHPDIFPAGELPLVSTIVSKLPAVLKQQKPYPAIAAEMSARTIAHAAGYYLQHIAALNDRTPFLVDKMPHNFLHLGLIALMFPHARIIHMRRDPRDTALSNYQQHFKAKHGMLGYSVNLEWTGRHINDYYRLVAYWRRVLPVDMFELDYEALVMDQEATTAKLLDFVGVSPDNSVTQFHRAEGVVRTASVWQVRQGIYTTSARKWRRYEKHLKPLIDTLNPETYSCYDVSGNNDLKQQ